MKTLVINEKTGGAEPMDFEITANDAEIRINLDDIVIAVSRDDIENLLGVDDGK